MPSIADSLLARGCVQLDAVHGERVVIISGADIGKQFVAIRELVEDVTLGEDLMEDRRQKRVLRFRNPCVPNLAPLDRVQTEDGKIWRTVRRPENSFLTTDFELVEVTTGDT